MARQLPLDLRSPPALGREDFLPAPANQDALAMLDDPPRWPDGRLLLTGPEGAGKSHMAAFWAAERGVTPVRAVDLTDAAADLLIAPGGAAVIEDIDRIAGQPPVEAALFHLWNLSQQRDGLLLMTARPSPPRDWGLHLPDLQSRIEATARARLEPPDEGLLAAVLVKLFADRQLAVQAGLIDWLARNMDRDLGLARRLVAALDAQAMAESRAPNRRMAVELLDNLSMPDA